MRNHPKCRQQILRKTSSRTLFKWSIMNNYEYKLKIIIFKSSFQKTTISKVILLTVCIKLL